MLRSERDYILRMIAAAAAVAGRLRERLTGGASGTEVAQEARAAQTELLGKESTLLRTLDPQSAAHAIGDRERLEAWIDLLRVEAQAIAASGDSDRADALERRVATLQELARAKKK